MAIHLQLRDSIIAGQRKPRHDVVGIFPSGADLLVDPLQRVGARARPGRIRRGEMAAATICALPLGMWLSTLRRKWTRQRCQAASSRTLLMAPLRPSWASDITSARHSAHGREGGPEGAFLCRRPRSRSPRGRRGR